MSIISHVLLLLQLKAKGGILGRAGPLGTSSIAPISISWEQEIGKMEILTSLILARCNYGHIQKVLGWGKP
jgi:hypothetical protein